MTDHTDDKRDEKEVELVSRRKLVYVAPVLMSRRMFYRAAGCGKVNPNQRSCVGGAAMNS